VGDHEDNDEHSLDDSYLLRLVHLNLLDHLDYVDSLKLLLNDDDHEE